MLDLIDLKMILEMIQEAGPLLAVMLGWAVYELV